ncbi:acyl-CoA dehydrogenase family protein [Rhodococcus wratislaviensis]|uniref:acyl-CoA dehydrogenase family protein n=1 Tax=Rhodococcus wratislaviensis TaxID=44752 RepID=UPI0036611549
MDLLPTNEQDEIVDMVSSYLGSELPGTRQRALWSASKSWDDGVWKKCAELGWFGLGLPEKHGGVGLSLTEEALLFREVGRQLAPGPLISTVLGARVALGAGNAELSGRIIAGEVVVGLAQRRTHDAVVGQSVSGSFNLIDAVGAEYVLAVTAAGAAMIRTETLRDTQKLPCIDPGVRLGMVDVDGLAAEAFVSEAEDPIFLRGTVLAAAMAAGISQSTLSMAIEHAKTRIQFGKPIGVNQGIKHKCADMALRADAANWQAMFAAIALRDGRADAEFQTTAAKVVAIEGAVRNSRDCIHIHGGLGYTREHDSHRFMKRAQVLNQYFGVMSEHLDRMLDLSPLQD